jgi:hypothetical protein
MIELLSEGVSPLVPLCVLTVVDEAHQLLHVHPLLLLLILLLLIDLKKQERKNEYNKH